MLFSYVPGLSKWYGELDEDYRRLMMLGVLLAVSLGVFGIACAGFGVDFGIEVTCDQSGAVALLKAFGAAAIANQTAYKLSPKSQSRKYAQ